MQRIGAVALCVGLAAAVALPAFLRAAPPGGKTAAVKSRSPSTINDDLNATQAQISKLMPPTPALLADAGFRAGDGAKVLPLLKKMIGLLEEMEHADVDDGTVESARRGRYIMMAYSVALGDKETETKLTAAAQLKGDEGVAAATWLSLGRWLTASKDAAAQQKIIDDVGALAKANPKSEELVSVLAAMSQVGAATPELSTKALEIVRTNLKSDMATELIAQADAAQAQKDMIGKPLTFGGRTSTGGKFSTTEYQGKVVLVDFWATWCGPCIAGLPEVKKVYADFHGKGLEMVGVSCDSADDVLNKFIAENSMPWVQLRDSSQVDERTKWHPIAKQYGVDGIPAMFLIDRKGVLRYVDAREDLAKKVAELVAESDKPAAK